MRKFVAMPLGRLPATLAVLVALAGVAWANPSTSANIAQIEPEVSSAPGAMPPPPAVAAPEVPQQTATLPPAPGTVPPPGLNVVRWGLGGSSGSLAQAEAARPPAAVPPGRPLYLWITLAGGPAAVARLRTEGSLAIEVHWTRHNAGPGAPDLVTWLGVGNPALAPTLAAQVARAGRFQWHSWARKDTLSPGRWTVSLTYPDGRPVRCGVGAAAQPCRFSFEVG